MWAESFTSDERKTNAQHALQTPTHIFKAGDAPDDEQSSLVKQRLAQYQTATAAYEQTGTQSDHDSAQSRFADCREQYSTALPRGIRN